MRILIVTDYMREQGGIYTHIVNLQNGLRAQGHQVAVLCSKHPATPEIEGGYSFRALTERGLGFRILQFFNPVSALRMRSVIERFKPDLVHLHYIFNQASPSVIYVSAMMHIPVVLTIHGFEMVHFNRRIGNMLSYSYSISDIETGSIHEMLFTTYLYKWLKFKWYQVAFERVNAFLTPSKYAAGLLSSRERTKAYVVPHGIDLFEYEPVNNWSTILYVGRLIEGKGVDTIINAMPDILRLRPDVKLNIAGDGPYRDVLRSMVTVLGLDQSVVFLGRVAHDEVETLLRDCTVFVVPSTRPETFAIAGMEALSMGRPIVASDIGAVREWLVGSESCGILFEPGQAQQLAGGVEYLLSHVEEAEEIGKRAARKARQFGANAMTARTLDVYDHVVDRDSEKGSFTPGKNGQIRAGSSSHGRRS